MQILHINFITNNLLFKMNEHILFQTKKYVQWIAKHSYELCGASKKQLNLYNTANYLALQLIQEEFSTEYEKPQSSYTTHCFW